MAIWFKIALALNVIVWVVFLFVLSRHRWSAAALAVGAFHMLFASLVSFAPIRSLLDPDYIGYGLGVLHFEKRAVALPSAIILGWALAAAWASVSKGRGRWMNLVLAGDLFVAVSIVISIVFDPSRDWKFQLGEHFTATGEVGLLILLFIFSFPFMVSAVWAAHRSRAGGTTPPVRHQARQGGAAGDGDDNVRNSFRSEARSGGIQLRHATRA